MSMTDPVADLLTRIRNAVTNGEDSVDAPASNLKREIVEALKRHGFVRDFRVVEDGRRGSIRVFLKYGPDGEKVISHIQRVSRPGRRVYRTAKDLPKVLDGLCVAIVSTNCGILSDHEARSRNVGGEILCEVW